MWVFTRWTLGTFLLASIHLLQAQHQTFPAAPEPKQEHLDAAPAINDREAKTACTSLREQIAQANAKHDYAVVTIVLKQAASVCSNQTEVLVALAKAEMLAKQFEDSAKILRELLARDPHNVEALITHGELYYLLGQSSPAIASLLQASAAEPSIAEPHYLLGRVYYAQSNLQFAKAQFETALQLDANAYKAFDGLALCYENMGDTQQAAQTYMKGIEAVYKAHPEYDVIYADFAELMLRFNKSEKALALAAEAAQRNPHEARNYMLAGRALEQTNKYPDSIRWLVRAAQIDPAYPDPHLQLARIYKRLGDPAKSRQESDLFEKLLAQAPQVRR